MPVQIRPEQDGTTSDKSGISISPNVLSSPIPDIDKIRYNDFNPDDIIKLAKDTGHVTKGEIDAGHDEFKKRYKDGTDPLGSNAIKDYDIIVPWNLFEIAINSIIGSPPKLNISQVALRFVHAMEDISGVNTYFILMQLCEIGTQVPGKNEWNLVTTMSNNSHWYKLTDGNVTKLQNSTEAQRQSAMTLYKTHTHYDDQTRPTPLPPLTPIINDNRFLFVDNVVFPWQAEVALMHWINTPLGKPVTEIGFKSYSHQVSSSGGTPNIDYPHGLALYLRGVDPATGQTVDLLGPNNYVSVFANKGANFATLCEPNCQVYIRP